MAEMCRVEDLSVKLRQRRLRWFGHVKGAEGGVLSKVRIGGRGAMAGMKTYEKVK